MLDYLWIGIGGAIGSIARAWIALVMVRITGPQFPWGTILINIVGSFVIGLFSTLTLPDGLLPASPNVRVFVMVGICGGFTTFSAFSLQTLDLLRAGAPFRAGVNIVASVVLCVLAVTLGHLTASQINGGTKSIAQTMVEEG